MSEGTDGDLFGFSDGTRVRYGQPLRVYSVSGANSETDLYWGVNMACGAILAMSACAW